jgi:hypothetical protein
VLNHCAFEATKKEGEHHCLDTITNQKVVSSFSPLFLYLSSLFLFSLQFVVRAGHVVFATGAAADAAALAPTKGAHLAVAASRLPVQSCLGFQSPQDRRWCFCVPYFNVVVLGTTETVPEGQVDCLVVLF